MQSPYIYNFQKNTVFLSLKIVFILEKIADPDAMPHSAAGNAAFHLGLHCLPKNTLGGGGSSKSFCLFV